MDVSNRRRLASWLLVTLAFLPLARAAAADARSLPPACEVGTGPLAQPSEPPRALRFGVTAAGQIHSNAAARMPDDPAATVASLKTLAAGRPFVARIHHVWYADGDTSLKRIVAETRRYTRAGLLVSLQLRYGKVGNFVPTPEGYAAWLRDVVAAVGRNPRVVSLEIGNEFNLTDVPETSDGYYSEALEALVAGVAAADDEAKLRGYDQLEVGFTWFYRSDPSREEEFWDYVRDEGGEAFTAALDWVGINAFPGSAEFPKYVPRTPAPLVGRELVRGIDLLRNCYMELAGIPGTTPIKVTENSFPSGMGRTPQDQADALVASVEAVQAYSGDLNVGDYCYFTLRDVNTTSIRFESNYGLLTDDYEPKPAFEAYRELIAEG